MNKVILVGNLKQAPALRHTRQGVPYCAFTVDCARHGRRALWRGAAPTFDGVPCWAWGRVAEDFARGALACMQVVVEGRLEVVVRRQDGSAHKAVRVHAYRVDTAANPRSGEMLRFDAAELPF